MKKAILVILLFISLKVDCEEVHLGYINLRPHVYTNVDGEVTGPLITFLQSYIAPKMKVKFSFEHIPLTRIFVGMDRGELSGIVIAGETQERQSKYLYPKNNFSTMQPAIVLPKNASNKESLFPTYLSSLNIGYFEGAIVSPYMKNKNIQFVKISGQNTWERNIERLLKKRVDVIYTPSALNVKVLTQKNNLSQKLTLINLPEPPIKLFTVFSKSISNLELVNRYDKAFEEVNGNEVYHRLLSKELRDSLSRE